MAIIRYAGNTLTALSTDIKPTNIPDGARLFETNTLDIYVKVGGSWVKSVGLNGSSGYISKFTADNTLGNSIIYDNGTNVGIGTVEPFGKLSIVPNTVGDVAVRIQEDGSSAFDFIQGIAGVTGDALFIKDSTLNYDYLSLRSGNVGIGTTNPNKSKLQLLSTGSGFTQERTSGTYFYSTGFNGGNPYLTYYAADGMTIGYVICL